MDERPRRDPAAYWSETERLDRMRAVLGNVEAPGSLAACVAPMMVALDWFGAPRTLAALTGDGGSPITVRAVAEFLGGEGFASRRLVGLPGDEGLASLAVGSLVETTDGRFAVYVGERDGQPLVHDGARIRPAAEIGAVASVLAVNRSATAARAGGGSWLNDVVLGNPREPVAILGISAFLNLLAIAVALFTMTVYNHVIPSGSTDTLASLLVAAMIAILGGWLLRIGRTWAMARYGGWAGYRFGTEALGKTLDLPYDVSSRLGTNQALNRFRSIEGIRQFLSGVPGGALLDGPFVVIFVIVIGLIGGWIAFVPLIGLAVLAALAIPMSGFVESASRRVGVASTAFMETATSVVSNVRAIKALGESGHWMDRFAGLAADLAVANRDFAARSSLMQAVGHAVSMATVLCTMAAGVILVLDGVMNAGGLIAAMMLVWRIVGPAERAFVSVVRLRQLRGSIGQLDRLMATPSEFSNPQLLSPVEPMRARLRAERLVYRYNAEQEPALNGVGFAVDPGEVVVVVGPNGAGKTTFLECLAGLRSPQAGTVFVDDRDIRQFDPTDYRAWVGFAANRPSLFPIDVRTLLRLKHPECSEADLEAALTEASGQAWREALPAGLDTLIDPFDETPANERRKRMLGLAVALIGSPSLLLLDDPVEATDGMLDTQFKDLLTRRRADRAVVFSTHRPDLIRMADKVLVLDKGNVMHFGPVSPEPDQETGSKPQ